MAVTNDLVTDRRVLRHAATLREAGHDVVLVGRNDVPTRHSRGWRFYAGFNSGLCRRLSELAPDVVWANDTDTLPGCWRAARKLHRPLVMDAHELFPEVPEIRHKPVVKWVWRTIERCLMPQCDALLTVCRSIADYYRERYGVEMRVVRNLGRRSAKDRRDGPEGPSASPDTAPAVNAEPLLLYQGKVNVGRGVDWAIDALEFLPECRLVVAGDGDLLEAMRAYAAGKPWRERIEFTGRLAPEELARLTPQADVGLVMLDKMGLNYHFALPNRIGDFVAAGVPMVVSDMPEMAAVVRRFGVGEVIERKHGHAWEARALAEAVERVLTRTWSDADFEEARKDMDWEKEKAGLLECLKDCGLSG